MTQFSLKIDSDNAALTEYPQAELARILRDVARRIEIGRHGDAAQDINGNTVGSWWLMFESEA